MMKGPGSPRPGGRDGCLPGMSVLPGAAGGCSAKAKSISPNTGRCCETLVRAARLQRCSTGHGPQPALQGARRARSCSLERAAPSPPGELQKLTLKHLGTEMFPGTRLGLGRALGWTNLALLPLGWRGWRIPYGWGWKEPEAGHPPAACSRPKQQRADAPSAVDLWTFAGPRNSPFSPSSLGSRVSRFPSSLPKSSPSSYRPRRPSARRGHRGAAHTSCT